MLHPAADSADSHTAVRTARKKRFGEREAGKGYKPLLWTHYMDAEGMNLRLHHVSEDFIDLAMNGQGAHTLKLLRPYIELEVATATGGSGMSGVQGTFILDVQPLYGQGFLQKTGDFSDAIHGDIVARV